MTTPPGKVAATIVVACGAMSARLPVAERAYGGLAVAKNGDLYFVRRPQPGGSSGPHAGPPESALMRFNFATRKDEQVLPGAKLGPLNDALQAVLPGNPTPTPALDQAQAEATRILAGSQH